MKKTIDYETCREEQEKHIAAIMSLNKELQRIQKGIHHHTVHLIECRRAMAAIVKGDK